MTGELEGVRFVCLITTASNEGAHAGLCGGRSQNLKLYCGEVECGDGSLGSPFLYWTFWIFYLAMEWNVHGHYGWYVNDPDYGIRDFFELSSCSVVMMGDWSRGVFSHYF